MEQTGAALHRREEQLDLYSRLEPDLPSSPLDPQTAIAGVGWLFDLLPKAARERPIDPSGVMELHRCLAVLKSGQAA